MSVEIGVSIFVAAVTLVMIGATWYGRSKREPFVRALEHHYQSLDGTRKPDLRVVPREKHPTPKQSQKAARKR
ncbi:MAG: hypothetical protein KAY59_10075 [Acidobacteria bacterium]|nr:hypothetical protein [Acidobacteriota bacterium]